MSIVPYPVQKEYKLSYSRNLGTNSIFHYNFDTPQSYYSKHKKEFNPHNTDRTGLKFLDLIFPNSKELETLGSIKINSTIDATYFKNSYYTNILVPDILAEIFCNLIMDYTLVDINQVKNNNKLPTKHEKVKHEIHNRIFLQNSLDLYSFTTLFNYTTSNDYHRERTTDEEKNYGEENVLYAYKALKKDIDDMFSLDYTKKTVGSILVDSLFHVNKIDVDDEELWEKASGYDVNGRGLSFNRVINNFALFVLANEMINDLLCNDKSYTIGDFSESSSKTCVQSVNEKDFLFSVFEKFNSFDFTVNDYTLDLANILISQASFNNYYLAEKSMLRFFRDYSIPFINSYDLITMVENDNKKYFSRPNNSGLFVDGYIMLPLDNIEKTMKNKISGRDGIYDFYYSTVYEESEYRKMTLLIREMLIEAGFDNTIDRENSKNVKDFNHLIDKLSDALINYFSKEKHQISRMAKSRFLSSERQLMSMMIIFQLSIYLSLKLTLKNNEDKEIDNNTIFNNEYDNIIKNELTSIVDTSLKILQSQYDPDESDRSIFARSRSQVTKNDYSFITVNFLKKSIPIVDNLIPHYFEYRGDIPLNFLIGITHHD